MKNFFNLKAKDIAIIVLIILILIGGSIFFQRESNWKTKYNVEVNLRNALEDSVRRYQNKEGEWVAEKLTLQADINTLEDDNINLTKNQEELIKRVKKISKEKDLIAAALAEQEIIIDSLINNVAIVDTINNTVTFEANTDSLEYKIKILNVKSIKALAPTMVLDLSVPNSLFIEFHWEDGKTHPVSVSVTNSNSMFKTNDIDSYAIPELQKDTVKPKGWKKIGNFFKKSGKYIGVFGAGALIGGIVVAASGG